MWSDTLQQAERLHFLRLCLWGALATLAGTALVVFAYVHAERPVLVRRFGGVCGALGLAELLIGMFSYRAVPLRNVASATRLDRVAWLQLGLFLGLTAVGVTLALTSRVMKVASAERPSASLAGTGVAVALHGLALTTLELLLIAQVSR
jgi:hypothetical protein